MAAADQRSKVAKLFAAAKRWHQPLLASAFQAWAAQTSEQRIMSSQLQQAVAHWLHTALASAFNTWRYQVKLARGALHQPLE